VQLGTAAVDNFYTRSLLGRDVFHAPAGALTHAHLARAAAVLARFDVVLILEVSNCSDDVPCKDVAS
jgi:hypothetical protein